LKPGYLLEIGNTCWKLDSPKGYLTRGDWIGATFGGAAYQDDTNSEFVSRVKIKTVLVKSNNFFSNFVQLRRPD
jgi:hypothetical protein